MTTPARRRRSPIALVRWRRGRHRSTWRRRQSSPTSRQSMQRGPDVEAEMDRSGVEAELVAWLGVKMGTADVAGVEADWPVTERPALAWIFPSLFFSSTGAPILFSSIEIWHPPSSCPQPMALLSHQNHAAERRCARVGVAARQRGGAPRRA